MFRCRAGSCWSTTFGSLFIVTGKRYAEARELGDDAHHVRATLGDYTEGYLRFVLAVSCAGALVSYCVWAFETKELARSELPYYELSIVPMLTAFLRYALGARPGPRCGARGSVRSRSGVAGARPGLGDRVRCGGLHVTFEQAWAAVADVDGWMTEGQARALYEAGAACPPGGRIVEIGSFQGRSTIVLALAAPADVEIVAIDPHAGNDRGPQEIDGYEDAAADDHAKFEANLVAAGVRDRVTHLRQFSDRAHQLVDGEIDVLYVDGAHRYGPARVDIRDWGARVKPGGTLLIHDSFSSIGVTAAILRELLLSNRFRYVTRSRSLAVYEPSSAGGRAGSAGGSSPNCRGSPRTWRSRCS